MLTVYVILVVLFTNGGIVGRTIQAEDAASCAYGVTTIEAMTGQEFTAADGTKVKVLDAQAKCVVFTQGLQAKN